MKLLIVLVISLSLVNFVSVSASNATEASTDAPTPAVTGQPGNESLVFRALTDNRRVRQKCPSREDDCAKNGGDDCSEKKCCDKLLCLQDKHDPKKAACITPKRFLALKLIGEEPEIIVERTHPSVLRMIENYLDNLNEEMNEERS